MPLKVFLSTHYMSVAACMQGFQKTNHCNFVHASVIQMFIHAYVKVTPHHPVNVNGSPGRYWTKKAALTLGDLIDQILQLYVHNI